VCGSQLDEPDTSVEDLNAALHDLRTQLAAVETSAPRRVAALTQLPAAPPCARRPPTVPVATGSARGPRAPDERCWSGRSAGRVDTEPDAALALSRLRGGLPLAAARLHRRPRWPLSHLVNILAPESTQLDELALGDDLMTPVLDDAYRALTAEQATLCRALGALPMRRVDPPMAAAALGCPIDAAKELVCTLVDAYRLSEPRPARHMLADQVRLHAIAIARTHADESTRAVTGLLDCLLHTTTALARCCSTRRIAPYVRDRTGPRRVAIRTLRT